MMTFKMLAVAAVLAFALPGAADAQHKHGHAQVEKGKHGGQMVEAGDYHVELVSNDGIVEVHLSDHDDKPVPIAGYKGLAILSVAGKSQRIVLEVEDGKLTGKAGGALPSQPKGVVQITPPNGKTVSAKF
jgi:hypothetical protein